MKDTANDTNNSSSNNNSNTALMLARLILLLPVIYRLILGRASLPLTEHLAIGPYRKRLHLPSKIRPKVPRSADHLPSIGSSILLQPILHLQVRAPVLPALLIHVLLRLEPFVSVADPLFAIRADIHHNVADDGEVSAVKGDIEGLAKVPEVVDGAAVFGAIEHQGVLVA